MEKNNSNPLKVVLITLSVVFLIIFAGFVIIKSNAPLSIILRQGFKQLTGIELIDNEKVRQIESELSDLRLENNRLNIEYGRFERDREEAEKVFKKQEEKITSLNQEVNQLRTRNQQLREERREITPIMTVYDFDELTHTRNNPDKSVQIQDDLVQTPIERIEEANIKMIEGINAIQENEVLIELVDELFKTITPLQSMNASLENQLDIALRQGEIALAERDRYKDLYLEVEGKTRKNLLIAYGVIALETTIIVLMLLNR